MAVAACSDGDYYDGSLGGKDTVVDLKDGKKKERAKKRDRGGKARSSNSKGLPKDDPDKEPAYDAPLHSLSGTVRDSAGRPLEGMCVQTYDGVHHDLFVKVDRKTKTNAEGFYIFRKLDPGLYRYRVRFVDCRGTGFAPQWYDHVPSTKDPNDSFRKAVRISISFDGAATGIDATMIRAAVLDGVIRGGGSALGGKDGVVEVYDLKHKLVQRTRARDGRYRVGSLAAGKYRVRFSSASGSFAYAWYPDAATFADAAVLDLGEGARRTLDASLGKAGTIEGRIDAPGACAFAYPAKKDVAGVSVFVGDGDDEDERRYVIKGLRAGTYRIKFDDCDEGVDRYAPRWYESSDRFEGATPVRVGDGGAAGGVDGSPRRKTGGGGGGTG